MWVKSVTPKTTLQLSKEPEYFSPSVLQLASGAYAEPTETNPHLCHLICIIMLPSCHYTRLT